MNVALLGADLRVITRGVALSIVLLLEIVAIDAAYSFRDAAAGDAPYWQLANETLQIFIYASLYASMAFCVLAFAQAHTIFSAWIAASKRHPWLPWFVAQTFVFALVLVLQSLMQGGAEHPPWALFSLWLLGCGALVACAALALAPWAFWREQGQRHAANALAAMIAGLSIYMAIAAARESWRELSSATLSASYWILNLYEPGAVMDQTARVLGARGFQVVIDAPCSGYEGIGLVLGVLGFYIFAFRRDLRFPAAFILLPIGAATIWLLNALRLALLVSIGAHVSPDLALQGFHSQAGWIFFLVVTISLMVLAHQTPALRADPKRVQPDPALRLAAALLIPFAALMASRIVGSIFGAEPSWPSVLAIVLPASALLVFRREIGGQLERLGLEPVVLGLAVGAFWIVTHDPNQHGFVLGRWLEAQPAPAAGAWVVLRIIGFALIVPLAEELAFRGYLHRALIGRHFDKVTPHAFGWLAFIGTTLLFGAPSTMAERRGGGAVFAIALYRSKSLAGPIAAHIVANATIALLRGRDRALGFALRQNTKGAGVIRRP
ncbi:MAG: exosortase E/protease, VPEID-CTERM system [Hyphomonadaceae bacterium]